MNKIIIFSIILFLSCKDDKITLDVTSDYPDIRKPIAGLNLDTTYQNEVGNNNFYNSNCIRLLNYVYTNRKSDTKSYEVASGNLSLINWNKEEEILFVNFGSDGMCYSGFTVFYGASESTLKKMGEAKISFEKNPLDSFFTPMLTKETDKVKSAAVINEHLHTNSCKP